MLWITAMVGVVWAALAAAPAFALSETADNGTWSTNGKVFALARLGNTLFIGGKFTKLTSADGTQSVAAANLAAIDMTTGAAIPGFSASVASSTTTAPYVHSLGVSPDGSVLYVGGKFDVLDGQTRSNLAAVSTSTGDIVSTFVPRVGSAVHGILIGPSGTIYFGGAFKNVNGKARSRLAAVAPDGSLNLSWVPAADDVVRTLTFAPDGATIFVGGHFTLMNGVGRQSVARVTSDTGALDPWAIPAGVINTPQTAWALVARGTRLYGGFGKGPNYLAAFRLDNGTSGTQLWRLNTVGNVESLALNTAGTKLFFGGHFGTAVLQQTVCGNKQLRGLAA
ncbi:MAG: hypothetical protein ACXVYV_05545, partial [Gaiellales bacterium]